MPEEAVDLGLELVGDSRLALVTRGGIKERGKYRRQ